VWVRAIDGFGEQASDTGLTRATRAGKQVGMTQFATFQGVLERLYDWFLTNKIIKCL
jgi:hypothetical protein